VQVTSPTGTVPCPGSWEPIWCCDLPSAGDYPGVDVETVIGNAVDAAATVLYQFTAQRFGTCEVTLRPCRRDCAGDLWPPGWAEWAPGGGWPRPVLVDGNWFNLVCGGCPGGCACTALSEALLPGPVHRIVEVKLDGQPLAAGVDFRVDDHRRLVRLGGASWPLCQHLELADTQPGTWSVTAEFGVPLPVHGKMALGELACAFIKSCLPGETCPWTAPVQQLIRQGVSVNFLDPNQVFAAGRVGLTQVDLFIAWANPHRLPSRPQVYDVDGPAFRRAGTG
jgi:hypothetical protein